MPVASVALYVAIGGLLVAFGALAFSFRALDESREASEGVSQGVLGRLDEVEKVLGEVLQDVTLRVEAVDTRVELARQEFEGIASKVKAAEGRIDAKRAALARREQEEEEAFNEEVPPWERNGAPPEPEQPADLQAAVFRLRHGRRQ